MLNKFIWNILLIFTFSNSAFYFVIFNSSGHFFHLTLPMIFIFRNILSAYFLFYISYFQNPWPLKKKPKNKTWFCWLCWLLLPSSKFCDLKCEFMCWIFFIWQWLEEFSFCKSHWKSCTLSDLFSFFVCVVVVSVLIWT